MGNHEYCPDCGENDYHHGRPCDPEKIAKIKRDEEKREKDRQDKLSFADRIIKKYPELEVEKEHISMIGYTGCIVIRDPKRLFDLLE